MITVQIMLIFKKLDLVLEYTAKNTQVVTSLFTSCDNLLQVYNKPISGCVRMACAQLVTTSLLQVVNRLVASF